jgi:hypothetical protein
MSCDWGGQQNQTSTTPPIPGSLTVSADNCSMNSAPVVVTVKLTHGEVGTGRAEESIGIAEARAPLHQTLPQRRRPSVVQRRWRLRHRS